MKKLTTCTILVLLLSFSIKAQPSIIEANCYGGSSFDAASEFQITPDGGYIVIGQTQSNDGDVSGNNGYIDYWLIKVNNQKNIEWQRCLGGSITDRGYTCQITTDGSYIVSGLCSSNDGNVSGNHGASDYWVVKLDTQGNTIWKKCYGGVNNESAYSMKQTPDGGCVIAGIAYSTGGDVTGNHGECDYWVVKLDDLGNIEWQNALGGYHQDVPNCIQQTSDGGFIVCGSTLSDDGDVTGYHGVFDSWVVKLDNTGNLEWQRCYGGSDKDNSECVLQTSDGGYIIAGSTKSNDGDVSGNHGELDCWIVKVDNTGNIQWQKCFGGSNNDMASSVIQTSTGNYIISGNTESNDGDVSGNHGDYDCWIIELDQLGKLVWQLCAGGSAPDFTSGIQQTNQGDIMFIGNSYSNDGDVTGNNGSSDYWLVKLDYSTMIKDIDNSINIFPNPVFNNVLTINTNYPELLKLKLFDINGNLLIEKSIDANNKHIDLNHISDGIYIIQVSDQLKTLHQQKIIKSSY